MKKIIISFIIVIILVVGIALFVLFYNGTGTNIVYPVKNINNTIMESNNLNNEQIKMNEKLIFPGATLTGMRKDNTGDTSVTFKTFSGGVIEFYRKELNNGSWKKIEELGAEDMTKCGGDWGGIYEKAGTKVKVHVCGFDQSGALKDISLLFYNNANPEDILGKDFLNISPNCVIDGVINSAEACDTGVSIKFKLTMKSDKIKNFRANLGSYAWKEIKNTNNLQGIVEFETPYEKGWEWAIEDASVFPTVNSDNNSFDCSSSRKEVKIVKCSP